MKQLLAPQFDEIIADDNSQTSDYLDATIHLINHLKQTYSIDNKRIYTTGQSGGAMMSIAMNIKYPEFFTASYIVAGQWDAQKTAPIAKNKLFILVSENDTKAFPGQNAITKVLAENGGVVKKSHGWDASASVATLNTNAKNLFANPANIYYATFKGGTLPLEKSSTSKGGAHVGTWAVAYNIPAVQDWLFSQRKP